MCMRCMELISKVNMELLSDDLELNPDLSAKFQWRPALFVSVNNLQIQPTNIRMILSEF